MEEERDGVDEDGSGNARREQVRFEKMGSDDGAVAVRYNNELLIRTPVVVDNLRNVKADGVFGQRRGGDTKGDGEDFNGEDANLSVGWIVLVDAREKSHVSVESDA